ncbi:MAG: transposase [Calditrichaceae bacterium]|nr:transposase [Calditrichaceae bacterium]MBN2707637.1 transposase [Calditrichaceae bacterium]RQV93193.1 MAG: transposase [Calditrichota bacterium]
MTFNPEIHHRRSIRLKNYNYTQSGYYFITLCTKDRQHLFGEIVNGKMIYNTSGEIVHDEWLKTAEIRDSIELDESVVMPNHFHGIIKINNPDMVGARRAVPLQNTEQQSARQKTEQFGKPVSGSIPTIVRSFKSAVTKKINEIRKTLGLYVWQKNYGISHAFRHYEHIIRNENELYRIRTYIKDNPKNWETDKENV